MDNIPTALAMLVASERNHLRGMFRGYKLVGRDWLKTIPAEDRKVFSRIGQMFAAYGHLGGVARAKGAQRDKRGRFVKCAK